MRWYLNRTGQAEGPFDEPTILGMIGRGEVLPHHQICVEGQQAWQGLQAHPPFAHASSQPAPQVHQAAHQVHQAAQQAAPQFEQAAHQVAGGFASAANQLASGGVGPAPQLSMPTGSAAPGQGFFEQAKARNEMISEEAKKGASFAHILGAAGVFLGCWACGLGGVVGAFVGKMLYKEQPASPFALFHMNQAFLFQAVIWAAQVAVGVLGWVVAFVGAMIADVLGLVGYFFYLINLVLFMAAVIVPVLQFGKAKKGEWSEYPLIGARVMRAKAPMLK